MTTVANVKKSDSSHWYFADGNPCYELPKKSAPGEMRVPTLADARKLNLYPSVTTILKIMHKEGLVNWLIEQACLAVLTTPRLEAEGKIEALDAFVQRVLSTERVQDQEAQIARDRGTEIHDALEGYFQGREVPAELQPWIMPAAEAIAARGELVATERILVGDGYAGKCDLIQKSDACWWLWDWKTSKKLPDPNKGGAWEEHVLQAAAYAKALDKMTALALADMPIRTGNVYISTAEQGKFVICEHGPWAETYEEGFKNIVKVWQWKTKYKPEPIKTLAA